MEYSRRRFLGTWIALGCLAILTAIALIAGANNADTNNDQTEDIARLANDRSKSNAANIEDTQAYLRGDQGLPGVPGASGVPGTPGLPGTAPDGEPGAPGDIGSPGIPGEQGPPGPIGETGSIGPIGPEGPLGQPGETGSSGAKGEKGAQGEGGQKGDPGEPGAIGPSGPSGPTGPPGPQTGVQVVTASSAFNDLATKSATAQCPAGFRIIGGGFVPNPGNSNELSIQSSFPTTTPQAWTASGINVEGPWQIVAFAVCEEIA